MDPVVPELVQGVYADKPPAASAPAPGATAPLIGVPTNDSFANALVITGGRWSFYGDTTSATTEAHEPLTLTVDYNAHLANTVWYRWTAPASGEITLDTLGTTGADDTMIAIFTGSTMKTASRKAADDDVTIDGLVTFLSRIAGFEVIKGTVYHFQVGQIQSSPRDFKLTMSAKYDAPSNDAMADAVVVPAGTWTGHGSTYGASIEPAFEGTNRPDAPAGDPYRRANSVWWRWTAPAGEAMTVTTAGSAGDTYLAIYEKTRYGDLREVAFSDDTPTSASAAITGLQAFAGSTFYFQVGHITSATQAPEDAVQLNFTATTNGPRVTKVSPASGPKAGGTRVTITGTRFTNADSVTLNGSGVPFTLVSSTTITFIAPTSTAGIRYIAVGVLTYGDSLITSAATFTYK
jgi:hypothetical protein